MTRLNFVRPAVKSYGLECVKMNDSRAGVYSTADTANQNLHDNWHSIEEMSVFIVCCLVKFFLLLFSLSTYSALALFMK